VKLKQTDILFNWGYNLMYTVIETPSFQKQAERLWTQGEHHDFIDWIAQNPTAGSVIPGADGARKVRWSRSGQGKRAGVRVIYFNIQSEETVLLIAIYAKADAQNMKAIEIDRSK
jgi:mRNA-degrading endonuclease RelE of RelBE toxin-antitoxin system